MKIITLFVVLVVTLLACLTATAGASVYDKAGSLLIADQSNNRVIQLNDSGRIVWHFGTGVPLPGPRTVVAPRSVQRTFGGLTLIVCGSVQPGTPGYPAGGVIDNRVLLVNRRGRIVWQYGTPGVTGSGPGQLNDPVDARMAWWSDHIFIVDQGNDRVIEVTRKKRIVWQYGTTGVAGAGVNQLDQPAGLDPLPNGRLLIADQGNDRVIEVKRDKTVSWSYGRPGDTSTLDAPASVRLEWRSVTADYRTGHMLITDRGNDRIVRVARDGQVLWTYATNDRPGSVAHPLPAAALPLRNGHVLISDGLNQQVIELAVDGMMVWSYGTLGVPGIQWGQLDGPRGIDVVPVIHVMGEGLRARGSG